MKRKHIYSILGQGAGSDIASFIFNQHKRIDPKTFM